MTSHERTTGSVFVSQAYLRATESYTHNQPNTKDADMEKALLSCDVTTEVLMRQILVTPVYTKPVSQSYSHT